jgi:hypothetical protein
MTEERIALSDMIVDLRRELLEAQQSGTNQDLKFNIEEIEVELQITASREVGAEVGVKFWVYNANAHGKLADVAVQKLRLKLKPILASGTDFTVGDRDSKPSR